MITDGFDQPSRGHQGLSKKARPHRIIALDIKPESSSQPGIFFGKKKNMGFTPIPKTIVWHENIEREFVKLTIKGGVTSRKKIPLLNYSGPKFAFTKTVRNRFKLPSVWQTNLFAASNISAFFDGFLCKVSRSKKDKTSKKHMTDYC